MTMVHLYSPASDNDNTHSDSPNENFIADTIKSLPLHHSSTEAIDHEVLTNIQRLIICAHVYILFITAKLALKVKQRYQLQSVFNRLPQAAD